MKTTIKSLLVLAVSILMTACGTEDDTLSEIQPTIEGVWQVSKITRDNIEQNLNVCQLQTKLSLFENHQFDHEVRVQDVNGDCQTDIDDSTNKLYTVEENALTLSFIDNIDGQQSHIATIISLSESTLVLRVDYDDENNTHNQVIEYHKGE